MQKQNHNTKKFFHIVINLQTIKMWTSLINLIETGRCTVLVLRQNQCLGFHSVTQLMKK